MGLVSRVGAWLRGPSAASPAYEAASTRGARVKNYGASRLGVNAALQGSVEVLRARSHKLMGDDAYVWRAMRAYVASLIGTGITPQSQVEDEGLRKAISAVWTDWTDDADARGRTDFYGLQVEAAMAYLLSGEVLARLRDRRPEDGLAVPLQIELLEADHLPVWKTELAPNGNEIKLGIEFGPIGNRVAYHLYRAHPMDNVGATRVDATETVRVLASSVLHVYESNGRSGQLRGEPRLSRVLLAAHFLNNFDDATLEKARVAASITGWIRKESGDGPLLDPGASDDADAAGAVEQDVQVGALHELLAGEEIQFAPSADVGDYEVILKQQLRRLSSGTGTLYEHATGDYEGVTYSSLREAKNQQRREIEQAIFSTLNPQFNLPIWRAWMDAAVLNGLLPISARDYRANRRAYQRVRWVPTRQDYVDPLKEVNADKEAVRCGFRSVSDVIRSRGEDPERVFAEIAADNARAAALGIQLDTNPATAAAASTAALAMTQDAPPPARGRRAA